MLLEGTKEFFPYAFIPLLAIGGLILVVLNALGIAIVKFLKKTIHPAKGNST